ncbi:MAG: DEAD/DEAH box helicase family protein [Gemmataceae bacterium]|nr:DEAD/DEAH box helicase family protein [Gemmataceae bacterium]
MAEPELSLRHDAGTVLLTGADDALASSLPGMSWDVRTKAHRAEGRNYRFIIEELRRRSIPVDDRARAWGVHNWVLKTEREPFPHQSEGVAAWQAGGSRGVVVLPTGTGKTFTAILAIHRTARPTLVVTPTLDLLNQWHEELIRAFGDPVGLMGGGHHDLQPLTVTTYDSAYIYVEKWADRFGMLVFDECHHLPGPTLQVAARGALAPFRLGLTATPERADGLDHIYPDLIGPTVYRKDIRELTGEFLAEYTVERVYVDLSPEDQERYLQCRETYRGFLAGIGLSLGRSDGLRRFIIESARSREGAIAWRAFQEQRKLALAAPAKIDTLSMLLERHRNARTLIFTADNSSVYAIARKFLIPAITHQTKTRERKEVLDRFRSGEYSALATSQVLNEGVDVPAAAVGIILSGTGSVREHVQRLGRLLRKVDGKQAVLYEVVSRGTSEEFTSDRRRQHGAYR